jgi:hypothetical protein
MSEPLKALTTYNEYFDAHFNPWSKETSRNYPDPACIGLMTVGIATILSTITTPAIAANVLLKNAVCLTGVSLITAGLTNKKGYVILPASIWLLAGMSMLARPLGLKISDFYTRNIKPIPTNNFLSDSTKAIQN